MLLYVTGEGAAGIRHDCYMTLHFSPLKVLISQNPCLSCACDHAGGATRAIDNNLVMHDQSSKILPAPSADAACPGRGGVALYWSCIFSF